MNTDAVVVVGDVSDSTLRSLLDRYGLSLSILGDNDEITGSFWGEPEAGVVGTTVLVRNDTPVHSLLHEAGHIVCMTGARRARLYRDAGGDDLEESAVCYLQILLAAQIEQLGADRLMQDMDTWGYSFRLGCTRRWFTEDAADARRWLQQQRLLSAEGVVTFALRH